MLFDRYCEEIPDGETKKIFSMNLVKNNADDKERMLAAYYEELLESVKDNLQAENKQIGYHNYNWHAETKQSTQSFTNLLNSLDNDYLRSFGIYQETRNPLTKEGVVQRYQTGLVRTNCIDCLDRTNVAKMITAQKAFDDFVWRGVEEITEDYTDSEDRIFKGQALYKEAKQALVFMWAYSGDIISKIYSGTPSVLTAVTLKGHEDLMDKFVHYKTSIHRWEKQKFTDEFKHECI